jgi:hypothetical protein
MEKIVTGPGHRRSGTVRRIQAEHALVKLAAVTGRDYRRSAAP